MARYIMLLAAGGILAGVGLGLLALAARHNRSRVYLLLEAGNQVTMGAGLSAVLHWLAGAVMGLLGLFLGHFGAVPGAAGGLVPGRMGQIGQAGGCLALAAVSSCGRRRGGRGGRPSRARRQGRGAWGWRDVELAWCLVGC